MERQLAEALKVLGIPADSDHQRVTDAYRRLARMTHPDVSPDPEAAERFATLTAAYRLVSASTRHPRPSRRAAPSRLLFAVSPPLRGGRASRSPIVPGPVMVRPAQGDVGAGEG